MVQQTTRRGVSLFSNCGAGDLGYRSAGFRFEIMADKESRRLDVALLNHPGAIGVPHDLRETWTSVVDHYREKADERPALLAACPPCQGMSSVNSDRGMANDADAGSKDARNLLVEVIHKVAATLCPDIIVVENVPAFLTRKVRHPETGDPVSAAKLLTSRLSNDYHVFPFLTDLADYGVPQSRKRAFLTFIRKSLNGLQRLLDGHFAPYPRPTHATKYSGKSPITLKDALNSFELPSLDAKSESTAYSDVESGLHFVPIWDDRRYPMVAAIPINTGASAWDNDCCPRCGEVEVDLDDAACPICGGPLLRPVVKEADGTYRLVKGFRDSSYRRMHPDRPAATITTASGHIGSSFTIHPYENRVLSPLECAYLQTFPADFKWGDTLDKYGHTNIRSMIGEAVPPRFTQMHGEVLIELLSGKWSDSYISLSDERCVNAIDRLLLSTEEDPRQVRQPVMEHAECLTD